MKKKLIIILGIILIFIVILFTIYKVDSMNRKEKRIINATKELMNGIRDVNYNKIKIHIKNTDGTDLSDQELSNFLINTGLYRTLLFSDTNLTFTYHPSVNFFNTNKGHIVFSFVSLDGNTIYNEFEYINTGTNEYLIADKIQEHNKEKEKYPVALDLANGNSIEYNNTLNTNDISKLGVFSFVQDENGNVFVEILKEAKEDFKISLINSIYEELDSLKKINEKYNIEWDNACKEFSVYYDTSIEKKVITAKIKMKIFTSSLLLQTLDGNADWHLTINYYDCNTKELLKTETIR